MTESNLTLKDIAVRLFKANAIKFGSFTTQSGAVTPVYFDLRVIVSYPTLLVSKFRLSRVPKCLNAQLQKDLSILLSQRVQQLVNENQRTETSPTRTVICGVPITALPVTTLVAVHTNIPMIMKRKAAKNYGTKELIEGVWEKGDTCILIDDVIMFGDSILETVEDLVKAGKYCVRNDELHCQIVFL